LKDLFEIIQMMIGS